MLEYTILLFLLLPCPGSAQLVQVCDPASFAGSTSPAPPFPEVPSQFSIVVEANLGHRLETIIVTEYYDQVGDRGRIEINSNRSSSVGIFDFNLGEIFMITGSDGDDCQVYPTTPESMFSNRVFGFEERNGTIHIGSPAGALLQLRNMSASPPLYVGEDTIRGIPVNHWQLCVSLVNNSYLLDYFFTRPTWTYTSESSKDDMVLVQVSLNASFIERFGTVRNSHHIYSFVDFKSGPDSVPDKVFTVPNGLACKGRIPGLDVPQLPDTFSGRVEFIYHGESASPIVVTMQEFYNFPHSLFRVDYYDKTGPVSVIHDFNQGLQYKIEQNLYTCNITRLEDIRDRLFDVDVDSAVPQLSSPSQLSLILHKYNYSYEGVTKVRGIDADSWVSVRDFERFTANSNISNATVEVFFSRPGWLLVNGHSVTTKPAPLRTKISGVLSYRNITDGSIVTKPMSLQFEMFDFSDSEPPYDAFDITPCFDHDDLVHVVLILPGQLKGLYMETLRESVRVSISNYTGVSPLQVSSISVLGENGTDIFLHVNIANISGLATSTQENRVTASEALAQLVMGTQDAAAPFLIQLSANLSVAPSIHSHGQGRHRTHDCNSTILPTTASTAPPTARPPTQACNTTDNNIQNQLALKDREIIGIAIGLLFGGILIGIVLGWLILCLCRCACRGSKSAYDIKNQVKYQKHDDDVAVN